MVNGRMEFSLNLRSSKKMTKYHGRIVKTNERKRSIKFIMMMKAIALTLMGQDIKVGFRAGYPMGKVKLSIRMVQYTMVNGTRAILMDKVA